MGKGWEGSDRVSRLPKNWKTLRARILRRDNYLCQELLPTKSICGKIATEVDHILAGDDHRESNLRSLCKYHHSLKSSREGNEARVKKRKEISSRLRRKEDEHPLYL